ncbi:hypothetical protein Tco_0917256 [Tanacetum coccineum]
MDFEVTDASIQQNPEQIDEEFTTTAYPNVQENLKLPTEDQVRLEEPASSAGTLSSLLNLDKELSFADQFLLEESQEDEPEKTNIESEVPSMVMVPIHQDTSSVPLMTTLVIDLTVSQPVSTTVQAPLPTLTSTRIGELEQHMADLVQDNLDLEERLDKHGSRLYKLKNLDIPHQVSKAVDEIVTDAVDWAIQAPLRERFRDLPEADMKEILYHHMWETKSYEAYEDHKKLYEALEKKKKRRHESPKTPLRSPPHQPPPPPPPSCPSGTLGASGASGLSQLPPPPPPPPTNQSDQSKSTAAPSSLKTVTSAEYTAWTIRCGLKKNASMKLLLCMVSLTGGSKDNDSTLIDIHLRVTAELADLSEYIIAEKDFKYLYLSDFEDLYLLNLQGHLNHLSPQDKKILSTATQLNLTKPRWDATGFEYKHDFTIIESPRAVTFRDKYGVQMIMRFNEIHKFSDGTLQQIDEALDYRVKEFKVNRMNPGLNTQFWTRKDVDRSKEFMFAIQKRLKTRRIFRNLECFVGGRVREGDYRLLQRTE